ncbi:MAG: flavodoxin family protein, partial [Oscillospiraceae bacterium]|nr:flavodoxin family protein [Oscillospiraceae bacterium]
MKIVLIAGSPTRGGTTAKLSDSFTAGAEAAGHTVTRFDLSDMEINLCRSCNA